MNEVYSMRAAHAWSGRQQETPILTLRGLAQQVRLINDVCGCGHGLPGEEGREAG